MTNKTNSGNIFVVKNCHSFLLQSAIVVLIVILLVIVDTTAVPVLYIVGQ